MRIVILGAGNVGKTLGEGWSKKHQVTYVTTSTPKEERANLARDADVIVLAVPADQTLDAIAGLNLAGKTVVDCTNPLKSDLSGLAFGYDTSAAERVAAAAAGAKVLKAFNTVGFNVMANPRFGDRAAMMMIAGDDAAAKQTVSGLATDLGFEPVDAGPLTAARLLEPLAMLWISLAFHGSLGRDFAFGLLRRS